MKRIFVKFCTFLQQRNCILSINFSIIISHIFGCTNITLKFLNFRLYLCRFRMFILGLIEKIKVLIDIFSVMNRNNYRISEIFSISERTQIIVIQKCFSACPRYTACSRCAQITICNLILLNFVLFNLIPTGPQKSFKFSLWETMD